MTTISELSPGAFIDVERAFLSRGEADEALARLTAEIDWRQEDVVFFGKRVPQPRLSLWMGDAGARYTYSGVAREPAPWHPQVRELGDRAARIAGVRFDSALLNLYRDGRDSMGLHADDEPELGPEPIIASLSLGATRRFTLRPKQKRDPARVELALEHGSLIVMRGLLQAHWVHGVPKQLRVTAPRINVTYRAIVHGREAP